MRALIDIGRWIHVGTGYCLLFGEEGSSYCVATVDKSHSGYEVNICASIHRARQTFHRDSLDRAIKDAEVIVYESKR
jgi:hypothetical protein